MSRLMRRLVNEDGFTLMEGLVSIVILSIITIGIYNTVVVARKFVVDARRVTEATNFARKKLEKIVDTDFQDITLIYSAIKTYDANPYDANYRDQDPDYDYIGDYNNSLPNAEWRVEYSGIDPLAIRLTVSWRESSGTRERSVQLSTRVTEGRM